MGRALRWWLQGEGDDPIASSPVVGGLATRSWRIGEPGKTIGGEASPPQKDGQTVDPDLGRYPIVGGALGGREHDPGSHDQSLFCRSRSNEGPQPGPL